VNKDALERTLTFWCFGVNVRNEIVTDEDMPMSRLTITLDDDLHRAVKETAARQGRSIGQIIEESLHLRGIKSMESAYRLVARARSHASYTEEEATRLATEEARAHRAR
jgi:predicted transcriptional regulator